MPKLFSLLREPSSRLSWCVWIMIVCWWCGQGIWNSRPAPLHYSPVDVNGGLFGPPFPVVHDQLLCLAHIEEEVVVLAPHCQLSDLPIGCLIVLGDQAYHCCVVSKLNDGVGVVFGPAVVGEQGVQEGTKYTPLRGPSVGDQHGRRVVAYPYHLGAPVRKSRIQLQREVFSPRVLSLVMSFMGTMVLSVYAGDILSIFSGSIMHCRKYTIQRVLCETHNWNTIWHSRFEVKKNWTCWFLLTNWYNSYLSM